MVTIEEAQILAIAARGEEVSDEHWRIEFDLVDRGLLAIEDREGGADRLFVPYSVSVLTPAGREALAAATR